jgi:co-chaperonin GroES (HSP10)
MSLIPLGHRILVRPHKLEDIDTAFKTAKAAGIYIQETTEKLQQTAVDKGIILAVGESAFKDFNTEPWAHVGDLVAYARYGGKIIKDPDTDEDLLILNDEDLICKIVKE